MIRSGVHKISFCRKLPQIGYNTVYVQDTFIHSNLCMTSEMSVMHENHNDLCSLFEVELD